MLFRRYTSPIGCLLIAAERETLTHCLWEDATDAALTAHWTEDRALQCRLLTEASRQLEEYFSGARKTFDLTHTAERNSFPTARMAYPGTDSIRRDGSIC